MSENKPERRVEETERVETETERVEVETPAQTEGELAAGGAETDPDDPRDPRRDPSEYEVGNGDDTANEGDASAVSAEGREAHDDNADG
jgi:hypothetical protein